ncbi:conserved hypothetical protein [Hyphomonas neptunium ATCC 15444]|uniref:Lipoprotein n=2 Tax=Hyphomonas TaxID=85 RepID=Q0C5Y6_HYPNA|nr:MULTISPECIES: hypothetical protein [Hyphomonas]ABI75601.1 conserved hypothetical protein [Hyphomonas neptunium ATCC 15444]KCZ89393.1 hypothetical protein HHI_14622 [Hyphomonas hirschiana VP5]
MPSKFIAAGLALAALAAPASARPVSYAGGWTVMQENNGMYSSLHLHYSPTATDSIGLYTENNWDMDAVFTGLQYNRLVKRWNAPQSQGNLYLKLGAGAADPYGEDGQRAAGFAGLAADWETRRVFVSYDVRARDYGSDQSVSHAARIGLAPYVAGYGDLHTWAMVQVENHPEADNPVQVTPLLRLFTGPVLVEAGYTLEEDRFLLNWIYRF